MKLLTVKATLLSLTIIGMTPMAAWADCNDCIARCQDTYDFNNPNADTQFYICVNSCYTTGECSVREPGPE